MVNHEEPVIRCRWAAVDDPLYVDYHDNEWGIPCHDERHLFEMLILEGAQAGLSWATILHKREGYRQAFEGFDPERIARYGESHILRLLSNPAIVRNRRKIEAAVSNARAWLELGERGIKPVEFLWDFVEGRTIHSHWHSEADVPAFTIESTRMSRALKERGFKFVGPTICYAFMQATGMVNDHVIGCFRHAELTTSDS